MFSVVRTFSSPQQAVQAADALAEAGYSRKSIYVVEPPSAELPTTSAATTNVLRAGRAMREATDEQFESFEAGNTLLVVTTAFGETGRAESIVDRFQPVSLSAPILDEIPMTWDEAAPLSSAFRIPVKTKSGYPLSEYLGIEILSSGLSWMSRIFPVLAKPSTGVSSLFGLKMRSHKAAPLSSAVGMKTITDRKRNWTSSLGMPLLSRKGPRASLMNNPAPLSSLLGLPTLSRY